MNADDFGLVLEVDHAIRDAHKAGTVTSATLMVNGEAVDEAAEIASAEPALGVGLHFTLTHGEPISDRPRSLVDGEGRFLPRRELVRRSLSRRILAADVEVELNAQLDRLRGLGIDATHIDGHQHIQVLPGISTVVAAIARSRGLPVRVPTVSWRGRAAAARGAQRVSLAVLCRLAVLAGLHPATGAFVSIFDDGRPREVRPEDYARLVRESGAATVELMVHPSYSSPRLASIHPELYALAVAEGTALVDPRTASALRTIAELVTYRELRAAP